MLSPFAPKWPRAFDFSSARNGGEILGERGGDETRPMTSSIALFVPLGRKCTNGAKDHKLFDETNAKSMFFFRT